MATYHYHMLTSILFTLLSIPKKEVTTGPVCGSTFPSASNWMDLGLKFALKRTSAPVSGTEIASDNAIVPSTANISNTLLMLVVVVVVVEQGVERVACSAAHLCH